MDLLTKLGYTAELEKYHRQSNFADFAVGRVIAEHKERYTVKTEQGDLEAEITGNLRFTANGREDFPAVGDWVAILPYDANSAIIQGVFPRKTVLSRQAVGSYGEVQVIAANVDCGFIVQAVNRDFSINRLERYLTICHSTKIKPLIILSKIDLINDDELQTLVADIKSRIKEVEVIAISNLNHNGFQELYKVIEAGKTYCMLGSSGVGKSTLINQLSGKQIMDTRAISEHSDRGKHVTTHRELFVLENGGIFIDNPGMRELGIADNADGVATTFDEIVSLSQQCKYADCTHTSENGCAVLAALENAEIDKYSYENYLKLEREKSHFDASVAERRKRDKDFGKMVKSFKKNKYKDR